MNNETPTQPVAAEPAKPGATGPRTDAGKAISSQNARKHDLCSRTLHLTPDEWAEYNDMRARYGRDLQPADDVEETLIDEICFNYWRLQQARDAELSIILKHSTELPIIALYIRYRTGYERAFYKALDQIQKRQRDRRKLADTAPASLASVRSADPEPAPDAPLAAAPLAAAPLAAAVRSADHVSALARDLEEQLENHLLENEFRAKLHLAPLDLPKPLAARLNDFVSQNAGTLPVQLLDTLKKAA